jgi:hypothetical protein
MIVDQEGGNTQFLSLAKRPNQNIQLNIIKKIKQIESLLTRDFEIEVLIDIISHLESFRDVISFRDK